MKGLLLKDWYLMRHYCKPFLLLIVVFGAVSLWSNDNALFIFYPCVFAGILPTTLFAYDEREKWCIYSQTLPVSKAQYVSAKYLLSLFSVVPVAGLISFAQAVKMIRASSFQFYDWMFLLMTLLAIGLLATAVLLPFVFRYGSEKGRIAYYIVIVAVCSTAVIFDRILLLFSENQFGNVLFGVAVVGVYAVSWLLSIAFYKKREI